MIAQAELNQVANMAEKRGLSEQLIADLKTGFPEKHFTLCTEDEIYTGKPVYDSEKFAIYLVCSTGHCSVLTNDLEKASGFVLAEYIEDF